MQKVVLPLLSYDRSIDYVQVYSKSTEYTDRVGQLIMAVYSMIRALCSKEWLQVNDDWLLGVNGMNLRCKITVSESSLCQWASQLPRGVRNELQITKDASAASILLKMRATSRSLIKCQAVRDQLCHESVEQVMLPIGLSLVMSI